MNTADLLDTLSIAVHRNAARRRRRRHLAVVASALALLVVGGVGVAGTFDDWWTGAAPAVQPAQLGELAGENDGVGIHLDLAKKATVARTDDAALDAVATNGGSGYCLSLFVGAKHMGSSCTTDSDSEYRSRADGTHWIGYGRILDDGAASLDLSGVGLSARVPLERGGFYLFDIPTSEWKDIDGRSGDIAILDSQGTTIRTACIFVGVAPPSPYAGEGALGDKPGSCAALKPIIPDPEVDKAQKLVSLTLRQAHTTFAAGEAISVWKMPNRGGGYCWRISRTASEHGSGGCARDEQRVANGHLSTMAGDGIVSGWAPAESGVVRVTVDGADAELANGAFLAEAGAPGPVVIVAYDASGKEVASTRLPAR